MQLAELGPEMCDAAWDVYKAAEQRDMRVRTKVATKLMVMFAKAGRAAEVNEIWAVIQQYVIWPPLAVVTRFRPLGCGLRV